MDSEYSDYVIPSSLHSTRSTRNKTNILRSTRSTPVFSFILVLLCVSQFHPSPCEHPVPSRPIHPYVQTQTHPQATMPPTQSLPTLSSANPTSFGRGTVSIQKLSSVLIVALDRPKVKNAFNDHLYLDLMACMDLVVANDAFSGIVLTGTGDFFSSGADLSSNFLADDGGPRDTLNIPPGQFMMALISFPKLFCAAVNGPTVGIGVTLLLHCDLVWCSRASTFWAPFTRLALVPELCSSVTFAECMGLSKANEMLLLGRKIDAETAVHWHIASRVVEDCDATDPFHSNSLAMLLAREIDTKLLQLPRGHQTAQVFCHLIRGPRMARLQQVCREELVKLDERMNSGECLEASRQLNIGKRSQHDTSKL
jgi:Delta3-Delta2-enoyl-CoA isomerase